MNVAAWIIIGACIGLLANHVFNDGSRHGRLGYVVVGILGAFGGVQLLSPAADPNSAGAQGLSISMLLFSAVGAGVLLFVGSIVRERFFP